MPFVHQDPEFGQLIRIVSEYEEIHPSLIEKDYWIMHCLYGLQQLNFDFQLKGGTSLSKAYGVINRFSEDIDIHITPPKTLRIGKNHDKEKDQSARRDYFDEISKKIKIDGIIHVIRDKEFDDEKYRNGGIRLLYDSINSLPSGLKEGILLELGFANVIPNHPKTISSWIYDYVNTLTPNIFHDNRAKGILCYDFRYTFVEKLQTISTKFRKQQRNNSFPINFIRHYYDIYSLLQLKVVQDFVGTNEYFTYKKHHFGNESLDIINNEAFIFSLDETFKLYENEYEKSQNLYYKKRPSFNSIITLFREWAPRL